MLTKPRSGWAEITIGNWSERLSYLDDVAFMLLDAMLRSCKEHQPASVRFDAEGYEYIIIFDWECSYVIELKDEPRLITLDVPRDKIAMELANDISKNAKAWASFVDYGDMSGFEKGYRELDLLSKCNELIGLLPSDDWTVVYQKKR